MSRLESSKPVIAIVGPTASGKSALSMRIAKAYKGEILCADSRTVYKSLDIGTAKPSKVNQTLVPHHGLDLVAPDQAFSAGQYQAYAREAISGIVGRGRLPVVVGGSGLYIDGLLYDFDFLAPKTKDNLDEQSIEELQELASGFYVLPSSETLNNRRHLIGFVRREGARGTRTALPANVLIIGLNLESELQNSRIEKRVDSMIASGLLEEVEQALSTFGLDAPGLQAPAYKGFAQYFNKSLDLDTAKAQFITRDRQLAKRQMTWFKRNKDIQWLTSESEAEQLIADFLNKFHEYHAVV